MDLIETSNKININVVKQIESNWYSDANHVHGIEQNSCILSELKVV